MKRKSRIMALPALLAVMVGGVAYASIFPDVPAEHLYHEEITALVGSEVINGNPDGNFYPERPVNRAEMLKMLYKATGRVPDSSNVRCFPDVIPDSWYESFVCDAAANRVVNGYPDGTFRPAQEVNRVEALKMILNMFGLEVPELTESSRSVVKFVDVSVAAWYTKYLYAAFAIDILPVRGQEGPRFYPDWPLLRGEAAVYIYNAMHVVEAEEGMQELKDVEDAAEIEEREDQPPPTEGAQGETPKPVTEVAVMFPFEYSGKFEDKKPFTFLFDIDTPTTVSTEVAVKGGSRVTCRLYLLAEGGFSNEYYLGHEEGAKCYLLSALTPGPYQLQVQPTLPDTAFTVSSVLKVGDGNDGFREASTLASNRAKTAVLEVNDITDWYTFRVSTERDMVIDVSDSSEIACLIYAAADVDLFGFSGPQCGQMYRYPEGTYYVAVSRKIASKVSRKTYTIQLR